MGRIYHPLQVRPERRTWKWKASTRQKLKLLTDEGQIAMKAFSYLKVAPGCSFTPSLLSLLLPFLTTKQESCLAGSAWLCSSVRPSIHPSAGANTLFVSSPGCFLALPLSYRHSISVATRISGPSVCTQGEFYKADVAATSILQLIKMFCQEMERKSPGSALPCLTGRQTD